MQREGELARSWCAAARDPQISGELELVYARAAREIESRGPACWASGRCCNFEAAGHRLYVTGLEAAYTVVHLESVSAQDRSDRPPDSSRAGSGSDRTPVSVRAGSGSDRTPDTPGRATSGDHVERAAPYARPGNPSLPLRALTMQDIDVARARGGCPFQQSNLCSVHTIKPLGCRVYFCDRSAQEWQRSLSEAALADIRAIHDAHAIEYRYGEWREMLGMLASLSSTD